jgi:hypothetical protein
MTDLSPEARSLFDAERHVDRPSPAEAARLRQSVMRRVGIGAFAVGSAAAATSTMTTGAVAAMGVKSSALTVTLLCVGMGALTGGAVTAAVTFLRRPAGPAEHEPGHGAVQERGRSLERRVRGTVGASAAQAPVSASRGRDEPAGAVGSPAASPRTTQGPTPRPETRSSAEVEGLVPPKCTAGSVAAGCAAFHPGGSEPPSVPDEVGVQVELLRESQRALSQGRPEVALARLDEHQARFPASPLLQERQAGRVFALCALGRVDQGRAEAAAFVRRFPGSPLAERVLGACSGPPTRGK